MSVLYAIRNALGFAYGALRDRERYVEGSHRSHYEEFYTKVAESAGAAAGLKPIPNGEVEAFYLGRVSEDSFVKDLLARVPQLASPSSSSPLKPFGGSTGNMLLPLVWELYRTVPSHAQLCSKVAKATGRLLWEMFVALDTERRLRIDTEDACEVILQVFQANGHLESEENIREWFCGERYIDFGSFFSALVENYVNFLQPAIVQELHTAVTAEVLKSGKMKKKGHVVHSWKERVFVLKETSLAYFDESNVQKGMVTINASTQVDMMSDTKHRFKITDGASGVVYEIQASNSSNLQDWISTIQLAIAMHRVEGRSFLHRLRLAKLQANHTTQPPTTMQTSTSPPDAVSPTPSPSELLGAAPGRKAASTGVHRPLVSTKSVPVSPPPYATQTSRQLPKTPCKESEPVTIPTITAGDFTNLSLNDAPPVPPRRFFDDSTLNLQPSRNAQVVPRKLRKTQPLTTDEGDKRRHSSIMGHSDISPPAGFEIEHVQAGSRGQQYALVTKFKKQTDVPDNPTSQDHLPAQEHRDNGGETSKLLTAIPDRRDDPRPPVSPNTERRKKELGYVSLHFHGEPPVGGANRGGGRVAPSELPRDVRTKFAYSKVVFSGPEKDTEAAQELKRIKRQPVPPPRYEGRKGMHKVISDSNVRSTDSNKSHKSKKSESVPDLTEERARIPVNHGVDYADLDFTQPPVAPPSSSSSLEPLTNGSARGGGRNPPGAAHPQPKPRSTVQNPTKPYENMTFDGLPCPPPRVSPRKVHSVDTPPPVPARKTS